MALNILRLYDYESFGDVVPHHHDMILRYGNELGVHISNIGRYVDDAWRKAFEQLQVANLSQRLLALCPNANTEGFEIVAREVLSELFPNGFGEDEYDQLDRVQFTALVVLHMRCGRIRDSFKRSLLVAAANGYREECNRVARQRYRELKWAAAVKAAEACKGLPTTIVSSKSYGSGYLIRFLLLTLLTAGRPEGWGVLYKSAEEQIAYCKANGLPLPALSHAVPLPFEELLIKDGDPPLTIYPGNQLPDKTLAKVPNTRKNKPWSHEIWVNTIAGNMGCGTHLQNHKKQHLTNHREWTLLSLLPCDPAYHLFYQDYFFDTNGVAHICGFRPTCMKAAQEKVTFNVAYSMICDDDGVYHSYLRPESQTSALSLGQLVVDEMDGSE